MLFGRDAELAEIAARLRTSRLITIVGPGGVGKTALSRAAATSAGADFSMGVREVDLTRVDQSAAVAGAVAAQLGFDSFDTLLSSPNDRPTLLLVDNCEHLLDAVAHALVMLLGACQQASVIATSRSPLELPGESIVALAPLQLPARDADPVGNPAVELFLQRARDAGATIVGADIEQVAELCRRLDGLPLAIEIAAARARTMNVAEITARMTSTIDVLSRPRFRGDPRHRSITDTIRWSVNLLAPLQAQLLERLAVFAGPFTAESGRVLAGVDDGLHFATDLDELINASLVTVETSSSVTRFRLLDTVRRFGLDQLHTKGELIAVYDTYVDHVVALVRQILTGAGGSWRPTLVHDLVMAFDDIAEAITHAVAHDQTSRRAYFLCGILWAIVHQYRAGDIVELGRSVMTRWPDDESPLAAQAIASLATAEYVTGHPDRAVSLAEGALARRPEPGPALIVLHRVLGQSTRALGDLERSEATFRAGAAIGHGVGLTAMALELDTAAALVGADRGDLERAMADIEEVVRRAEPIGSAITLSWAKTSLGWLLLRSDPSAALAIIEEALAEAQQIDYPVAVAVGLRSRAYAHLLSGDLPTAVSATSELLDDLLRRGALSNVRILFDVASAVAYRCGHPAWEQLAATTRSLPITTLAAAHDLVGLPATTAAPWPRLDAIAEVRHIIRELVGLALAAPVPAPAPAPAQPVRAATGRAWIAQLGDVWEFAFDRHTVAVRSAKGVIDIVRLIEAGGSEMHCLDLAEAGVEQASVGEVIDAKARRTYEQRIRDLQDDINEAEANSDYERSYRQQVELDALIEHLAAALGHGNRARRSTDTAERARSAVAHRVRITISRIGKLHPTLGRHLAHSVNTGIYCSYRPEQPTQWEIRRS